MCVFGILVLMKLKITSGSEILEDSRSKLIVYGFTTTDTDIICAC